MALACQSPPGNSPDVEALFPEGSRPENRIPVMSALCSYGVTQQVMQGAIRQLLGQHFADPDNILNGTLRRKVRRDGGWRDGVNGGPSTGSHLIESIFRWDPTKTEKRPGLIIKPHEWRWQRIAIGNRYGEDIRSGVLQFGGLWFGSHTVFAIDNDGAEALALAAEVSKIFQMYGSEIADQFHLKRFELVTIGECGKVKDHPESFVTPVTVGYVVEEMWELQPDAPRLKTVKFTASQCLSSY